MFNGNPRTLLSEKNILSYSTNGCAIEFEVIGNNKELLSLENLISLNCLVGPKDQIPGLVSSHLPLDFATFLAESDLSARKDLFAHNIKLSNMKLVEDAFGQFLR